MVKRGVKTLWCRRAACTTVGKPRLTGSSPGNVPLGRLDCVSWYMSRPIGTAAELERRRRRAVLLVQQGEPRANGARIFGVQPKSVARWLRAARTPNGLDSKPQTGPRPGLSDD